MSEEHKKFATCFFSPLWNAKPQTLQSLVCILLCVYSVIQISQLQIVIGISNLLSCENGPILLLLYEYQSIFKGQSTSIYKPGW